MRRSSCRICTRSCSSSADSGSSSSSTRGSVIAARASATRCCWPPDRLRRQAVGELGQPHLFHHRVGGLVALGLRLPAHPQRKGDVVADGQMRKQRVGLEHHRGAPLDRRQAGDVLAADHDLACGRLLVAGDHPQDRGLAAAGRPEKAAIGAVGNLQIDAVDHVGDAVIALAETCQFDIAGARAHSIDLNDLSRARRGAC